MINTQIKDIETNLAENVTISKKIELDENLTAYIIIDSNNNKIIQPILNKIVDFVMDNISTKDVYNKLLVVLENINLFIKSINSTNENKLNILIAVLENNVLHFAKVGTTSCYLINNKGEFIELSDRNNKLAVFDYISSGNLNYKEKVIFSNVSLLDFITQSDALELTKLDNIEFINESISNMLLDYKIQQNVGLISIDYEGDFVAVEASEYKQKLAHCFYKMCDNNYVKRIIALFMLLKDNINKKSKLVKNIIFIGGIVLSTFLLFSIISSIVGKTIESSTANQYKTNLIQAREYIRIANQNLANPEAFDLNIKKAEEIVQKVQKEKLYLNDVDSILSDISIIKKQFNGIEIFDSNSNNLIFRGDFKDAVKILELNKKLYVLGTSSIYGPIISGQDIKNNIFADLDINDNFADATVNGNEIIINTKNNRIVKFSTSGEFKYVNVIGQDKWEASNVVESYNGNIYLTNENSNQVFKHSPSSGGFTAGVQYLKEEDSKNIGKIIDIAVDGGIYILKNDLSILKFFANPKYRLESIVLNKLPKNYNIEAGNKAEIIANGNLSYFYMYLNKKIWIFKPNTRNFADTKSMNYIGQIEGKTQDIIGFYIPRDGEINVLTKDGIYKISFEISKDEKLILR